MSYLPRTAPALIARPSAKEEEALQLGTNPISARHSTNTWSPATQCSCFTIPPKTTSRSVLSMPEIRNFRSIKFKLFADTLNSRPESLYVGYMQNFVTGIGLLFGVVGIGLTIYYERKAVRIDRLRKSLEWSDLQVAATELASRISKTESPAAIIAPNLAAASFCNLLASQIGEQPPVFVGIRTWKDDPHSSISPPSYFNFETSKCFVSIPRDVADFKNGTILFVDDFVMSGDFLEKLSEILFDAGVPESRFKSASIVVTKVAIKNHKAPDFYWWETEDDEFYFPWGKAR